MERAKSARSDGRVEGKGREGRLGQGERWRDLRRAPRRAAPQVCLLCTRVALCNPAGVKHFTLTKVVEDSAAGTVSPPIPCF